MANNAQEVIDQVKASLEKLKPTDPNLFDDYIKVKVFVDMVVGVDTSTRNSVTNEKKEV